MASLELARDLSNTCGGQRWVSPSKTTMTGQVESVPTKIQFDSIQLKNEANSSEISNRFGKISPDLVSSLNMARSHWIFFVFRLSPLLFH